MVAERVLPEIRTLGELHERLDGRREGSETLDIPVDDIEFDLLAPKPGIVLAPGLRVPATAVGLWSFASYLKIPKGFWKKIPAEIRKVNLDYLVQNLPAPDEDVDPIPKVRVTFSEDDGVTGVRGVTGMDIRPDRLTAIMLKILRTPDAEVIALTDTPDLFAVDVRVPEDLGRWIGGEPDDVAVGGLRVILDRQHGRVPAVDRLIYRLIGQSAFEIPDPALNYDGRHKTVETVLATWSAYVEQAIRNTPAAIEHLYSMRSEPVDRPERKMQLYCKEQGIKDQRAAALMAMCSSKDFPEKPTEFDLVCLIANTANLVSKNGSRLLLERAAGAIIEDAHAARCGACQQKVSE